MLSFYSVSGLVPYRVSRFWSALIALSVSALSSSSHGIQFESIEIVWIPPIYHLWSHSQMQMTIFLVLDILNWNKLSFHDLRGNIGCSTMSYNINCKDVYLHLWSRSNSVSSITISKWEHCIYLVWYLEIDFRSFLVNTDVVHLLEIMINNLYWL